MKQVLDHRKTEKLPYSDVSINMHFEKQEEAKNEKLRRIESKTISNADLAPLNDINRRQASNNNLMNLRDQSTSGTIPSKRQFLIQNKTKAIKIDTENKENISDSANAFSDIEKRIESQLVKMLEKEATTANKKVEEVKSKLKILEIDFETLKEDNFALQEVN